MVVFLSFAMTPDMGGPPAPAPGAVTLSRRGESGVGRIGPEAGQPVKAMLKAGWLVGRIALISP